MKREDILRPVFSSIIFYLKETIFSRSYGERLEGWKKSSDQWSVDSNQQRQFGYRRAYSDGSGIYRGDSIALVVHSLDFSLSAQLILFDRLIVQPNLKTARRSLDGQFPECDVKLAPRPLSFRATYGWTGFIEGSIGHEFVG